MTEAEATAVARIVSTADHGCTTCISNLVERLNSANLGFTFALVDGEQWSEPNPWDDEYPWIWPLVTARQSS